MAASELAGVLGGSLKPQAAWTGAQQGGDRVGVADPNLARHSDTRYKTNIETLPNALDRVAALRGVSYDWRSAEFRDQRFPEGRAAGVLAQDVERVLPEAVLTGPNGYKGVYYAQLIPLLIESVKELKTRNEELRTEIADLKRLRPA